MIFVGVGKRSTLRFVSGYRPWMYFLVFTVVHTIPIATIWASYY